MPCGEIPIAVLKKAGRGVILGKDLTVRHSWNISIGDQEAIDDNVILDARGAGDKGIVFG